MFISYPKQNSIKAWKLKPSNTVNKWLVNQQLQKLEKRIVHSQVPRNGECYLPSDHTVTLVPSALSPLDCRADKCFPEATRQRRPVVWETTAISHPFPVPPGSTPTPLLSQQISSGVWTSNRENGTLWEMVRAKFKVAIPCPVSW